MPVVIIVVLVLIAILVASLVVGLTLKLLGYLIAGLIIGALARLFVPGPQALGWIATMLYGVAGSVIGGIVGEVAGLGEVVQFLLAVVAATMLIALFASAAPRAETRSDHRVVQ